MQYLARVALLSASLALTSHWSPAPAPGAKLGQCPHYWTSDQGGPFPGDSLPIAGNLTNVPEYNDCQRFVEPTLAYSDIQAIWIRDNVSRFYTYVDTSQAVMRGPAPSDVRSAAISSGAITLNPARPGADRAGVVGIIYSDGKYAPLGIKGLGWSCIVMRWKYVNHVVDPQSYSALIVGRPDPNDCTHLTARSLASGYTLQVSARQPAKGDATPFVTRWDWDPIAHQQYIGIWCPSGWCELHNSGYTASTPFSATNILPGAQGVVVREKGYYDQQLLADPRSAGRSLASGPVLGTVFPAPGLGQRNMGFYTGSWQHVASVSLSSESEVYHMKYLYRQHPEAPNGHDNTIAMCFAPDSSAPPPISEAGRIGAIVSEKSNAPLAGAKKASSAMKTSTVSAPRSTPRPTCTGSLPTGPCTKDSYNKGYWYAKFESPDKARSVIKCVLYRKAPSGVAIPSVVRWRWTKKDDTVWVGCPSGCCEVDAII